jgi:trigger factor
MNEPTPEEKKYTNLKVEHKPGSEIELTGEIPVEVAHTYRIKALKNIMRELELPGFRKGHVPEDIAMKHIGELPLMQETAEHALSGAYAQIVTDEKLDVVGRPNVTITKLAPGNPIGFKITSAVYPEVSLPTYKSLAEAECKKADDPENIEITESEIDHELKRLQEMMTPRGEVSGDSLQGSESGDDVENGNNEAKVGEKAKAP